MNKIIAVLLFVCFVFSGKAQSETAAPKENNNCKRLWYKKTTRDNTVVDHTSFSYNDKGKLVEIKGLSKTTRVVFNENGYTSTLYTQYMDKEYKISETESAYNLDNQLIRQVYSSATPPEELKMYREIIFEYHPNGKQKKIVFYENDFSKPVTVNYFNEKGYFVRSEKTDGSFTKAEYNALNEKIKQTDFNAKDKQTIEQLWEYNSLNLLSRYSKSIDGKSDSYIVYKYNTDEKLISEIQYNGSGNISFTRTTEYTGESYSVTTFNAKNESTKYALYEVVNGLLLKESKFTNDKLDYEIVYAYDDFRNLIKKDFIPKNKDGLIREEWGYECN